MAGGASRASEEVAPINSRMRASEFDAFCVALARMPEACRRPLVLARVCGWTDVQIARSDGTSVAAVRETLARGMAVWQMALSEQRSHDTQGADRGS